MFGSLNPYALLFKVVGVLALIAGAVAVFFYIKSLQADVLVQKQNVEKLQVIVDQQKKTMDEINKNIEQMKKVQDDLSKNINKAQGDVDHLGQVFKQSSASKKPRNFSNLADKKPGLIQDIINNGTAEALRCNEVATGSPLTDAEKSGKVKNSVCPGLIPQVKLQAVTK